MFVERYYSELIAEALSEQLGFRVDPADLRRKLRPPPNPALGDYSIASTSYARQAGVDPAALSRATVEYVNRHARGHLAGKAFGIHQNYTADREHQARMVLGGIWQRVVEAGSQYARTDEGAGETVVVEYSSPNIAKPFGIGHLRSTVIGNSLVRLYGAAGHRVIRLNYPGDWGTQFGLLLTAWKRWGDERRLSSPEGGVRYLVELYQRASTEAKGTEELAAAARAAFKGLEEGDGESHATWKRFRDLSLTEFQRIYDLFAIEFDSFDGEAATMERIPAAVAEIEEKGLLKESEGAQVVELGLGENVPPAMMRKSDGATTYLTRDFAEILDRWQRYHFERMIYVVGRDQELHFRQLFRLLELMEYDWAAKCVHVPFGMIRFGGSKMRTRKGGTIGLEDVLDRAFEEVGRIVEARQKGSPLDSESQRRVSRDVATGAVIFADLSRRRIKDFDFDWETAFSLDGDTGPYLQYAHARTCGILAKAGREPSPEVDYGLLSGEPERALLKALGHYPEAVARAREEDEPSVLGSHLLEIGRSLNHFYNTCRVLGEEKTVEDARLLLVWAARAVLAEALGMLGIPPPEAM